MSALKIPKWLLASQDDPSPEVEPTDMRRQTGEIKVKDFVDDKTKRKLVRAVASPGRPIGTPTVKKDEFLEYLGEARTTREIMTRFGYANLPGAWKAVSRRIQDGSVVQLGHGLYTSATAGVKQFNVSDLTDKELQERGYEALQRSMRAGEEPTLSSEPLSPPTEDKGKKHLDATKWMERYQKVVDYLAAPHTAEETANNSDYTVVSLGFVLKRLQDLGVIRKIPYKKHVGIQYVHTGMPLRTTIEPHRIHNTPVKPISVKKKIGNVGWGTRYEAIAEFLTSPHNVKEVMAAFPEYQNPSSLGYVLRYLVGQGLIKRLPWIGRPGGYRYIQVTPQQTPEPTSPDPAMEITEHDRDVRDMQELADAPVDSTKIMEFTPENTIARRVEDLAMKYAWETDVSGIKKEALHEFIKWVNEQHE